MISLCMFALVRGVEVMKRNKAPEPDVRNCEYCQMEIKKSATRCAFCTSLVEAVESDSSDEEVDNPV
jgi:large conductance mechanosensitive channel